MFNLFKMDLHRLTHSVSTYVMIVVVAAFAVFSISMTNLDMSRTLDDTTNASADSEFMFGIYVDTNPQWANGDIDFTEMISSQLQSRILLLLLSIFITLFVIAEQKNGFIKNIAGQFPNRSPMVAGKLASTAVLTFLMFAVYVVALMITCFAFWGNRLILNSATELAKILGIQYLLHFSFACFIAFLCFLINSSAMSMSIGIMLSCGVGSLGYSLIDKLVGTAFQIEKYTLEANVSFVGVGSRPDGIVQAVSVGICFIIATAVLSMLIVQKRDVR